MTSPIALDSSVAIALVVQTHAHHAAVETWWAGREGGLAGHALAETYAVLTRLPGDIRLHPPDAARLLEERFPLRLPLAATTASGLPARLARLGIAGGAVYDALVGLAALEHDLPLATRDARARDTYERIGVRVIVAG